MKLIRKNEWIGEISGLWIVPGVSSLSDMLVSVRLSQF
jgi:hypothetical protein